MHADESIASGNQKPKPRAPIAVKIWREVQRFGRRLNPAQLRPEIARWRHGLSLHSHWWLRKHTPYEAVFIITTPRTGSNLLVNFLERLPGTQCLAEVLNWGLNIGPKRSASTQQAIDHIRRSLQTLKSPVRGCKLFLGHLAHYRLTLDHLEEAFPGAKYIVLYRESLAEQYVSYELARRTNQWILLDGQQMKQYPLTIDPAALRAYSDEMRRGYHEVLAHPLIADRGTVISYEELTDDSEACMRDHICLLLGVPPAKPESALRKQNPQPLAGRVANYAQVAALIASPLCRQRYELPWRSSFRRKAA
jgi:LPS sulfotransferase NodH